MAGENGSRFLLRAVHLLLESEFLKSFGGWCGFGSVKWLLMAIMWQGSLYRG